MAGVVRWRLGTLAAAALMAGCSDDWSLYEDAAGIDAGTDVAMRPDVGIADVSEASTADVTMTGGDSGGMGPQDTGVAMPEASNCAVLTMDLQQARAAAVACTVGGSGVCMTTVTDECGCQVAVGGDATTENDFKGAIAAFEAAGCSVTTPTTLCPGTCPSIMHMCLFGAVDGSAVSTCVQ
jgi:hypothetical protein